VTSGRPGVRYTGSTRTSTITYDSLGEFATSHANALGQSESWIYDPRFGKPTSHTGPNGLTTTRSCAHLSATASGRWATPVAADSEARRYVTRMSSFQPPRLNGGDASRTISSL
jgi:hypothetical protein